MNSVAKAAAAACAAFAVAACSSQSDPVAGETAKATNRSGERISVSRTVIYDSVGDLANATPVIARVRIGDDAQEVPADLAGESPLKATIVTANVVKALKGELPDAIVLRLITSSNADSEVPAPLAAGDDYVLFLTPFEWEEGKPTGEWTVSGGAGVYKIDQHGALQRSDRGPDRLPTSIASLADLRSRLP